MVLVSEGDALLYCNTIHRRHNIHHVFIPNVSQPLLEVVHSIAKQQNIMASYHYHQGWRRQATKNNNSKSKGEDRRWRRMKKQEGRVD